MVQPFREAIILVVLTLLVAACGGSQTLFGSPTVRSVIAPATPEARSLTAQSAYWILVAASGTSQVQFTNVPLRKNSKVTTIDSNSNNMLVFSSGLQIDSASRLWILTFGKYGDNPASVYVFDLPLTEKSRPRYEFVLQGSVAPNQLALDASGNLWVTGGNAVNEYTGPFNRSGNLSPAMILRDGIANATGLAFDKTGNLYVANATSGSKASIAVFTSPISNRQPYFLGGLRRAGGLIFDAAGNLYASDNSKPLSAIVRYNSNNLKAGAHPDIVNRTRLNEIDEKDFAFTSSGDLYFTNCGAHPSIYWYPTGKRSFTAKLAPSVNYTNRQISGVGCVWGIAIK